MHAIKMRLDEWAQWSRAYEILLGYPKSNGIYRAMKYGDGAAVQSGYRPPQIPDMPTDIKAVDEALLDLRQIHPRAYEVIRAGHLQRATDKWLARHYRVHRSTCQRWKQYGYEWLEKKFS